MSLAGVARVARKHGLRMVVLFGSRVRGTHRPDSDWDLCVVIGSRAADPIDLTNDFSRATGTRADVVFSHRAGPLLRYHALFHGRLLFGRRAEFERLRLRVLKEWQDMGKIDAAVRCSLGRES